MARASSRDLLRSASKLAIAAATATLLTGCGAFSSTASEDSSPLPQLASSTRELTQPDDRDYIAGAAYWGAKFEANKSDTNAAISFARNLRLMGGARQAVTVMKDLVVAHPDDSQILSEYGKALTAAGRATDAVPFLARATQIDGDDWSTLSAYGVALDQVGSHGPARDNYEAALKLSPGNPIVESNLALSYLLQGQIAQAEPILRQLVARPDATPQMRQNLAMVESIRGNRTAAEQLVRGDLPKSDADNNISVLNQLSTSNAAADVQPLSAPSSEAPAASIPAAATPATASHPSTTAVVRMEPIADDVPPGKAIPTKPAAASAASTTTTTTATALTMSPTDASAPTKPAKQIITLAPIADDEPGKPAPRKPTLAATTPAKPALATTTTAPAATTTTAEPTPATPTAESATPATSDTPAPAATAVPTSTVPDGSQTSQRDSDPFRPHHVVNVAAATR